MPSTPTGQCITLIALVAAIASCDSRRSTPTASASTRSTSATAASTPRDPCVLITTAEAESILGTALKTTVLKNGGGYPTCEYAPVAGEQINGFRLTVYWTGGREAMLTTKSGQSLATGLMKTAGADPGSMTALEPMKGLGDEAYFNPMIGTSVLKDDTLLEFDIRTMMWNQSYEDGKALWRRLATKALTRLPTARGS